MRSAWARFAHGENPGGGGLPDWPAYRPEDRATMLFDDRCRVETDPMAETRALMREMLSV